MIRALWNFFFHPGLKRPYWCGCLHGLPGQICEHHFRILRSMPQPDRGRFFRQIFAINGSARWPAEVQRR